MRLIIVSGLSGSGKTVALHYFEDLGFYCIDNVPAALLASMIEQILATQDPMYGKLAIGIDARNRAADLAHLPAVTADLRARNVRCEVVFLHADDDVLLKRFGETRRKHPLSAAGLSLREAIDRERQLLDPIIGSADLVIDTTRTSVHQLRDIVRHRIGRHDLPELSILIESFGFKNGIPADADFVFDVRCLPNPYWDVSLRTLTGKDQKVADFLTRQRQRAADAPGHTRLSGAPDPPVHRLQPQLPHGRHRLYRWPAPLGLYGGETCSRTVEAPQAGHDPAQ